MEAGRTLDKIVHEKVMGEALIATALHDHPWLADGTLLNVTVPHYSTNIGAAWQLVEQLTQPGREPQELYFKMTHAWGDDYGTWAYFDWKGTSDGHPLYGANAPTVPHAICLAALKAVGGEP